MNRYDIINILIKKNNYKSYLEIGVLENEAFNAVKCETKHGVDPNVDTTYRMTSDEFFNRNPMASYDIIFIDGLHLEEQVYKDVYNSLSILNSEGTIVCHDMLPTSEEMQDPVNVGAGIPWTGDCWRAWVRIRTEDKRHKMFVVNTDYGCGVIQPNKGNILIEDKDINWDRFEKERDLLMNVITVKEFNDEYV